MPAILKPSSPNAPETRLTIASPAKVAVPYPTTDDKSATVPTPTETHAATGAAARLADPSVVTRMRPAIATAKGRIRALLQRIFGWRETSEELDVCSVCERPCINVNPEIPTVEPCAGRPWLGQCSDCAGQTVTLTERNASGGCPSSPLHTVLNKREKPYLTIVKGIPDAVR